MKRLLKEPLLHFLLLGAVIFALYAITGQRGAPQDDRIIVTQGKIDQFVTGFSRTWQRPPTRTELDGLIEDYVMEEVLYREALAMGLDKDDTIVRRRLRQKVEFLTGDTAAPLPTEQDLHAWLERHPEKFRIEPKLALQQIYLNVHRRGGKAGDDAMKMRDQLNSNKVNSAEVGDPTLLPYALALSSTEEVTQVFGEQFAKQLAQLEPRRWAGPIKSDYGLHLVYVTERTEGKARALAEIREAVERDWLAARRKEIADNTLRKLRERYVVVVQSPAQEAGAPLVPGNTANAAEKNP